MSAFLGPIHYWVYNKIQLQEEIVEEILKLSEKSFPELGNELNDRYDVIVKGDLEEIIDKGNIHGWLQYYVTQVENRLAYSVVFLQKHEPDLLDKIRAVFYQKGKEKSGVFETAGEVFKVMNDSLLDGMPCDHANRVLEESDDRVAWQRNVCVHGQYWQEAGGEAATYYLLREEFIKGMLEGTAFEYEKADETTGVIKRRNES